jgi:type VI secretion system protein ImpM
MSEVSTAPRLGFFGKLPSRGDFVTRRLPHAFTDLWDGWLQDAIAMSRQQLGEAWLDSYLTAPLWRFLVSSGVCGDSAMLGVLMSSVDRVGRYFPLTLAVPVSPGAAPAKTMLGAGAWFDAVEMLALSALEEDADLDRIDEAAEAVEAPEEQHAAAVAYHTDRAAAVELGSSDIAADAIDALLVLLAGRYTLWWTTGSEQFKPSLVIAEGLPPVDRFAALLDGRWEQWGWKTR